MNKRAITWLLATLLAISASFAAPVIRAGTGSATSTIVWIAQDQAQKLLPLQTRRPQPTARPAVPLNYQPPAKARHFAASLYQRPPPFLR